MNQSQVEQWIAANGGTGAVQYNSATKRIRNPARLMTNADGSDNPNYDPTAPEWIDVAEESWTNSKTGATLRVSRRPDNDFDVIENKTADPNKPSAGQETGPPGGKPYIDDGAEAGPSGRRWGWNPATRAYDRDLGPSPAAQKPPEVKPPTAVSTSTTEPFIVQAMPDGSIKSTPNPNYQGPKPERGTTLTIKGGDGKTYLVPIDAQGNPGKAVESGVPGEADKDAYAPEPAGAPEQTFTVGQLTSGLRAYSTWLDGQVRLHQQTNGAQGVDPKRATKLMERRIALAEASLKETTDIVNTQSTQRSQDIGQRGQTLQDTQSRRGTAERIATDVNTRGDARLQFLLPENAADHVAARQEEMQNALAYASQWGGMRDSPEVGADSFPALQQMRQASMAGIQTAAQGGPQIFDSRTIAAPPDPTAAAGAMANPAFRPPPPVGAAPAAASPPMVPPAVNPIDGNPVVLPTQLPGASAPPVRDDYRTETPTVTEPAPQDGVILTPYTPDQLQPGAPVQIPGAPPGQAVPYPSDAALQSQMPPGVPPRFMQEARYGAGNFFDPDLAGEQLSLELGIPPEIMRQARASLYG